MSMNARKAKLEKAIAMIEDVLVEYLADVAPATPNSADVSRVFKVEYNILHGVLKASPKIVDANPNGRRRGWTVEGNVGY